MLHGLTVSIVSLIGITFLLFQEKSLEFDYSKCFIGAECRLEAISCVTERSRGTIERVAATQLQNELSALVDKPVIATGTFFIDKKN